MAEGVAEQLLPQMDEVLLWVPGALDVPFEVAAVRGDPSVGTPPYQPSVQMA